MINKEENVKQSYMNFKSMQALSTITVYSNYGINRIMYMDFAFMKGKHKNSKENTEFKR
jgi:hypothetical protein